VIVIPISLGWSQRELARELEIPQRLVSSLLQVLVWRAVLPIAAAGPLLAAHGCVVPLGSRLDSGSKEEDRLNCHIDLVAGGRSPDV